MTVNIITISDSNLISIDFVVYNLFRSFLKYKEKIGCCDELVISRDGLTHDF